MTIIFPFIINTNCYFVGSGIGGFSPKRKLVPNENKAIHIVQVNRKLLYLGPKVMATVPSFSQGGQTSRSMSHC